MLVKFAKGSNSKEPRREQACAILWAQVHKDDPGPPLYALSDTQRRQLVNVLCLDTAVLQRPTLPTTVVSRLLGPGRDAA